MNNILPNTRRNEIVFYPNGKILLSSSVARSLMLNTGDLINIAEHQGEYLLHRMRAPIGRHQTCVYPSKKGFRTMVTNSISLCNAIARAIGQEKINHKLAFPTGPPVIINEEPYIPIITKAIQSR